MTTSKDRGTSTTDFGGRSSTIFWAEHALLPIGIRESVRLQVTDGLLGAVEPSVGPGQTDTLLSGLVLPGFANGHSHAFHRALRGRTHDRGGTFWTWRQDMYEVAARLSPGNYLDLARATFAEMVLAGYTVVGEFHYLHHDSDGRPYPDPNAMGHAIVQAADEAGIRLTLLDTCYLSGGLNGSGHLALDPIQQRFTDHTVSAWAERVDALARSIDSPAVRVGAAAHSVRAVPRQSLTELAQHANNRGWPLHIHLSEQPAENAAAFAYYGVTPATLLGDAQWTAVHATHLDDADIATLARSNSYACFCPTTERDLADGIGPARALRAAGVRLTIGSDQQAVIDPFDELRGLEGHERLRSGERGTFSPAELSTIGSANGYASLGWPAGGQLAVGALADFISVRTDSVRTAGCAPDQVAFAASASDVVDVIVAGDHVVRNGQHRLGDVGSMLTQALAELRSAGGSIAGTAG